MDRLEGDKVYFIGGYGTQTLASTEASDQTITVGFSVRGSWQFLQKHMAKPHALGNVTSFSELGATLTQRGITSENCGHRGLLDVIEFSDKTFILTACNNLWEGGRLLLGTVGGIETVGGVLVAWTFNGGIYTFNDQFRSNSSASLLPTLPGFEGKGGLVKEVTAAAKEVARMGKEGEKRREEIDQMRLATVMMGDMAVFDQKVKVTFGYGEGRGLQLELTNTSGQDLKGELWKVNLEVRSLQGSTWTHNLPLPACLLPLGRLSFHLPLPKLLPGESPLRIATKLIFTGASNCSMVATRILATNHVSFFELLHIDVISQSSTNFSHLQFNSGDSGLLSSLGIPTPQPVYLTRDVDGLQLEQSPVQVLREIVNDAPKTFLLDFFGRKLSLTVTPQPPNLQLSFSGESALVNSMQKELNALFPPVRKE